MPRHIVLLGDSLFDNKFYVERGEKDVVEHLNALLPFGDRGLLLAEDGSRTMDVAEQAARIPESATHLCLSIGGNDALAKIGFPDNSMKTAGDALHAARGIAREFQENYVEMLAGLQARKLPLVVCTIYNPRYDLPDPGAREPVGPERLRKQDIALSLLAIFNDVILRVAIERALPVVDLRLVCDSDDDYANALEPSTRGAEKIARKLLEVVTDAAFNNANAIIYR